MDGRRCRGALPGVPGAGFYGRLLEATATRLTIDVIAGSSAGGLNGAFLGMALARQSPAEDLDRVRALWLEAFFDQLLRSPWVPNPPSLLKGDEYFSGELWTSRCALPSR